MKREEDEEVEIDGEEAKDQDEENVYTSTSIKPTSLI